MNGKLSCMSVFLLLSLLAVTELSVGVLAQGKDCRVNGVEGKQCLHGGTCVEWDNGSPFCTCDEQFFGPFCEHELEQDPFCAVLDRCKNGGRCIMAGDNVPAFCLCKKPYYGDHCEKSPADTYCSAEGYCMHGGRCIPAGDNHAAFCSCPQGYTGTRCEQVV